MPRAREHPYIWATWLAKLLAGQDHCQWAGWFRAHHQDWAKPPSDFDSAQWMLDHTALLNRERERLEDLGHTVHVENQNSFRLRGRYATLAGKPDLIAVKNADAVIIDAKTGRTSPHHAVQVMIYQYAIPLALSQYQGIEFSGQLAYPDSNVSIPALETDSEFVRNLGALIRRLANDAPARKVPSFGECRFCDITSTDCPERVEEQPQAELATTEDF